MAPDKTMAESVDHPLFLSPDQHDSNHDNYDKYVLSLDEFQSIERKGIKHENIISFLLGDAGSIS